MERLARHLLPDAAALLDRVHGGERLHAELGVDPAAREVVDDVDLVARVREVQAGGPADEAVAAQDRDLHAGHSVRPRCRAGLAGPRGAGAQVHRGFPAPGATPEASGGEGDGDGGARRGPVSVASSPPSSATKAATRPWPMPLRRAGAAAPSSATEGGRRPPRRRARPGGCPRGREGVLDGGVGEELVDDEAEGHGGAGGQRQGRELGLDRDARGRGSASRKLSTLPRR